LDFFSEQHFVLRCAVTMRVQLDVDPIPGEFPYFASIHHLENPLRLEFVIINLQDAG
jgi:hypothetical protein